MQIPYTQGGKPKKLTLQGANKKNYWWEKQNSHTLQG
jgi:hypothetical protein